MAALLFAAMTQPITDNSRWRHKQAPIEVVAHPRTLREVSCIAADDTISGNVPQWQFRQGFQPVAVRRKTTPRPGRLIVFIASTFLALVVADQHEYWGFC
jgi:hypothetical protein